MKANSEKTVGKFQVGILAVGGLILAGGLALNPAAWSLKKLNLTDYQSLLGTLFFVALMLERALEVYVNVLHAPEAERAQRQLDHEQAAIDFKDKERSQAAERAETEIARFSALLDRCLTSAQPAADTTADARVTAQWCRDNIQTAIKARDHRLGEVDAAAKNTLEKHDKKLQEIGEQKIQTRLSVFAWSTFFGLFISACGLRVLNALTEPSYAATASPLQAKLLVVADIVLTGGVLAGGSSGIHKIVQAITSFFDAATAGNKEKARN